MPSKYVLPDGVTAEWLSELAGRLCDEVDAVENAKSSLEGRWRKNEQLYYVDSSATSMILVEGMPPYAIPVQRTKIDRLVGSTLVACTAVTPYVQVLDDTPTGENISDIETSLMAMATENGFSSCFSQSLRVGALSNIGVMRCVMSVDEKDHLDGGLQFDWAPPQEFMAYPIEVEDLQRAKTCGHRLWEMAYEVQSKVDEGEYIDPDMVITAMGGDNAAPANYTQSSYSLTQNTSPVVPEDDKIIEWDLITLAKIDGKWKRWQVLLAYTTRKILAIREWPYPVFPYTVTKFVRSEKRIFGNDSIAQIIQGLCQLVNDLATAGIHGTLSTSMPMTFIIGGLKGKGKAITYEPGKIEQLDAGAAVESIRIDFNLAGLVEFIQLVEPWIDGAIGISRIASSQELPANTKATAVRAMVAADSQKQDQYLEVATESMVGIWRIMYMYLANHFEVLKKRYGNLIPLTDKQFAATKYRFRATAISAASQNMYIQKLSTLAQMSANPNSTFDPSKVEVAVAEGLDLPLNIKTLQKDAVTALNEAVKQWTAAGIPVAQILMQAADIVKAQQEAQQMGAAIGSLPDEEDNEPNDPGTTISEGNSNPASFGGMVNPDVANSGAEGASVEQPIQ